MGNLACFVHIDKRMLGKNISYEGTDSFLPHHRQFPSPLPS